MKTIVSDVLVLGGGIAGLTFACALAQQTALSIVILETKVPNLTWSPLHYHHRVSAINLASQRIFQGLQVWDNIKNKRISPFTQIHVWDSAGQGEIHFDSKEIAAAMLGHVIENAVLQSALHERVKQHANIHFVAPVQATHFLMNQTEVEITTADARHFKAKLAIAADGAESWLRDQAGIAVKTLAYEQDAIIATVVHEFPHQGIARQVFLETGPLAFLPLADAHTSSIVWSLEAALAQLLIELNVDLFREKLAHAFSYTLGEVQDVGQRYAFPLHKQAAKHYLQSRVLLIGDAAHTIHPLAGLGLNMALLDAASLAEVMTESVLACRDFASLAHLRRYERWRRADNCVLFAGVDMLKNIFANDKKSIQVMRRLGLNLLNKSRLIKNVFTSHAVGNRHYLPKLALGEGVPFAFSKTY